jgi:hypothetical protein
MGALDLQKCDPGANRTRNLQLRRLLLYPLSYGAADSARPELSKIRNSQFRINHSPTAAPLRRTSLTPVSNPVCASRETDCTAPK